MRHEGSPTVSCLAYSIAFLFTLAFTSTLAAQSGQISGNVRDELMAGASGLGVQLEDSGGGWIAGATTAAGTGAYAFTDLADGDYKVRVDSDPVQDLVGQYHDGVNEHDQDLAAIITVAGGATVAGIDFVLSPGGTISGSVSGLQSGEVADFQAHDALTGRFRGSAGSDAGFAYTIESLPQGSYHLFAETWGTDRAVQWWDGHDRSSTADAVDLGNDEGVTGIDFTLIAGTSISGTVTLDPDPGDGGATVQQISLDAIDAETHHHVLSRNAATDGGYSVANLPPGTYILQAQTHQTGFVWEVWVPGAALPGQPPVFDWSGGEPLVVAAGSPATGTDFLLEEGRTISGHVFLETVAENGVQDLGEPDVTGASVHAGLIDGAFGNGTGTDGNGDYTLVGLPPGEYAVSVESSSTDQPFIGEQWDDRTLYRTADPVDVTTADASGIDFGVVEGHVISGQVFVDLDDDQMQQAGEPGYSNVTLRAVDAANTGHVGHGTVGPDGSWSIGLEPGVYLIRAEPHTGSLLQEVWEDVYFFEDAQQIDVTTGDAAGIDFGLLSWQPFGTLRGRLLAGDTLAPIASVRVEVWRLDNGSFVARAATGADGRYEISGLPPSPASGYQVVFYTEESNLANDSDYVGVFWSASGDPGTIDPDDRRVVFPTLPEPPDGPGTDLGDFELAAGGSLSGTVYPPAGEVLPEGIQVQPQSFESSGQHLPGAQADADGNYRIRGLPAPATYRVQAATWGTDLVPVYYLTELESTFDHQLAGAVQVAIGADTGNIHLHLFRGATISGTITRSLDDSPVANFPVAAWLRDDPLGRGFWANARSEADGTYALRGLPSGSYEVRTDGRDEVLANQYYPELVAVTAPDETPDVDFALGDAGRVRGRVTWIVDAVPEPVVNIRVEATDYATGDYYSDGWTDANGDYTIGSLPQGRDYRLEVKTLDGTDPQFFNFITEYYDGQRLWDEADPVSVPTSPGSVVEVLNIDFDLDLGGAISGLVTDGGGAPLQGVWVSAGDFAGGNFGNGDYTDHNGFYIIRGLPADAYRVHADPYLLDYVGEYYDDTLQHHLATPVSVAAVPAGGSVPITEDIDFALDDAYRVGGMVTEADGVTPLPYPISVSANGVDVAYWDNVNTEPNGTYEFRGLPAGRYVIVAETGGTPYIRQTQEVDLSGGSVTDIDFALEIGAAIRGRVFEDTNEDGDYDPGEELADAWVSANDFDTGEFGGNTQSTADGSYELSGLGLGSYRVWAEPDERNYVLQYWDRALYWHEATPVLIVEGRLIDVEGIDFPLVQGREIRGLVFYDTDGDGIQQPGEPPLENIGIHAEDQASFEHIWGHTGSDGTYAIHGVPDGSYRLGAHAGGTPYASEAYKLIGGLPAGTWVWSESDLVEVTGGNAAGVDFSLVLGGGITGTVLDAVSGEELAGIELWANIFDGDGLWWSATSDSQGRYLLDGLSPGEFRLQASDDQGIYVVEYHHDAIFWDDATPVPVAARSTPVDPLATPIDFDLDRGGAIEGFVYHDQSGNGIWDAGEPTLGGISVDAVEFDDPHRYLTGVQTEAGGVDEGTFVLGGLPPDFDLRLSVNTHPSDFLSVYYDGGDDLGALDWNDAVPVSVAAGETLADIDFGLILGGSICGRVLDGDGATLADQWVWAEAIDEPLPGNGRHADGDGYYSIRGLAAADYRVQAGGDPWAFEYYDGQTDWDLADPVSVAPGAATCDIDFVLPLLPRLTAGPDPGSGERGSTITGITVTAENLAATARLELGGGGLTIQNLSFDGASGTFTFDLQIAADAPLGGRSLSIVNDGSLEDAADVHPNAFQVQPASSGDVPAPHTERLYFADNGAAQIRVYGATDYSLLGTIDLCCQPFEVVASADGSFVYTHGGDRALTVIDTRLGEVGEEVARFRPTDAGDDLAATLDYLYVNDRYTSVVRFIDRADWEVAGEIAVGSFTAALELDPTWQTVWAADRNDDLISVIDVDPASGTLHTVLSTVPLPPGASPLGLAFTPDGLRALVVGWNQTFVVDTALALSDPGNSVVATLDTPGSGRGVIDISYHAASGKDLAYLRARGEVWVLDVSAGLPEPEVLRVFAAGLNARDLVATPEKLYISHSASFDFYAVDLAEILTSPAVSSTRFDGPEHPGGPVSPFGGLALAPTPGPPPAGAPAVAVATGSPAASGAPFTVTLSGSGFDPDPVVWLQGTLVRGTVIAGTPSELTVEFPALAPTGDHTVVVSNPVAGGNDNGLSSNFLTVTPPAGFAASQEVYVASYGTGLVTVYEPGGSVSEIISQPYSSGVSLTPDGRLAFVGHLYSSPINSWDEVEEQFLDVSAIDLDPDSPSFRQVVATIPYALANFSSPAITPAISPNGIFAYVPNYYFDAVSVIDSLTLEEVDLDGDPGTQTSPPEFFPGKLEGISRIELDGDPWPQDLAPEDTALTPDGTLLYVANREASVSIVDTVTHQVVGELFHGGGFGRLRGIAVTPPGATGGVFVYVTGDDEAGEPHLFVFRAGVLDDSAFVIEVPVAERPSGIAISAGGARVYMTGRWNGELMVADVSQVGEEPPVIAVESFPVAIGIYEVAEAPADGLLYVSNLFDAAVHVLDAVPGPDQYRVIATFGAPVCPLHVAVQPSLGTTDPVVGAVHPDSGAPDGGDPVILTGANFEAGASVRFGANEASGVVVSSSFQIHAVTPESTTGSGPVDVEVMNPGGATGVLPEGFVYQADATAPIFTTPPYVASQVLDGAAVAVEIRWSTDEASTSVVEYRRVGDLIPLQQSDPALVTDHLVVLAGLDPGTVYQLRATSADAQRNATSSPPAPDFQAFTTLEVPDTTAPIITSGPTVSVTTDSGLIQWTTHEEATSVVQFDAVIGDGNLDFQAFGSSGTLHAVTLTGLAANTEHELKVVSVDPSGNLAASAVATFTTAALPDATPPVITGGPEPSYLSNDLVLVSWSTDEPATSFVNYGTSSVSEQGVIDVDLETQHIVFLTHLFPGTVYGYQVGSTDASGNTVLSADPFGAFALPLGSRVLEADLAAGVATLAAGTTLSVIESTAGFTTPEAPDTAAPEILSATVTTLSFDRVLIAVELDEAASLRARYGVGGIDQEAFAPTFTPAPSLMLAGLEGDTAYQLTLELTDPHGNVAIETGLGFTTPAAPDIQAPVLSGLAVSALTDTTATIVWQTDEPADASIVFGLAGGPLDRQVGVLGLGLPHAVVLTALLPGADYDFQAVSRDASGNAGMAAASLSTLPAAPLVTSVTPPQAAQGTTHEVTLNGAHFGTDAAVDFGPGIATGGLTVNPSGTQMHLTITVTLTAAAGERQLEVTSHGLSTQATFTVLSNGAFFADDFETGDLSRWSQVAGGP